MDCFQMHTKGVQIETFKVKAFNFAIEGVKPKNAWLMPSRNCCKEAFLSILTLVTDRPLKSVFARHSPDINTSA